MQTRVPGLEQLRIPFTDSTQLFFGRHAVRTAFNYTALHLLLKARHSHHKEFVKIGAHDGEKFDPLKQGIALVLSLLQDSSLERKHTEFPVNIELRIVQRRGAVRAPLAGSALPWFTRWLGIGAIGTCGVSVGL